MNMPPTETVVLSVELPRELRIRLDMLRMMYTGERGSRSTLKAIFKEALSRFLAEERKRLHDEHYEPLVELEKRFGRLDEPH
jgi:hypothetical protein